MALENKKWKSVEKNGESFSIKIFHVIVHKLQKNTFFYRTIYNNSQMRKRFPDPFKRKKKIIIEELQQAATRGCCCHIFFIIK